jgi:hypothetical protein
MQGTIPTTAEEYINLVRVLGAMTDAGLKKILASPEDPDRASALERAAEAVETISSLRGDSDLFESIRPEGLVEYQKEMYAIEDALRAQLIQAGYSYPKR